MVGNAYGGDTVMCPKNFHSCQWVDKRLNRRGVRKSEERENKLELSCADEAIEAYNFSNTVPSLYSPSCRGLSHFAQKPISVLGKEDY